MGPITLSVMRRIEDAVALGADALAPGDMTPSKAVTYLKTAAHFLIDEDFMETVGLIAMEFPVEEFTDKMPHHNTIIEVKDYAVFFLGADTTLPDVVAMTLYRREDRAMFSIGHWRPKTRMVGITTEDRAKVAKQGIEPEDSDEFKRAYTVACLLSTMCELFCEPRIVTMGKPARHMRRQAQREVGELPTTWATVSWNIGGTTKARVGEANGTSHGKAYHLVRGHWRDYGDRHTPKAEQRPGHDGWWVWIDSHHSGNPAFGVRGHRYEPHLSTDSHRAIAGIALGRNLSA